VLDGERAAMFATALTAIDRPADMLAEIDRIAAQLKSSAC
jgi:hypothetical protein